MDFYARIKMLKKFVYMSSEKQKELIKNFNKIKCESLEMKEINPKEVQKGTRQYEFAEFMCHIKQAKLHNYI